MRIPDAFATRDSQTRIKHGILREYAGAWCGIISAAANRDHRLGRGWDPSFLYIDAFAGAGRYGRDTDKRDDRDGPVWGSPVHAIRMIAQTRTLASFTAILVEKIEENFLALSENLTEAGLPLPLHFPTSVAEVKRGACNLIHADFNDTSDDIARWAQGYYSLAFVDPYGAAMALRSLRSVLGMKQCDSIILFPISDIVRKSGSINKPEQKLTSNDRGNITRINNVFDSEEWQLIVQDYAGVDPTSAEKAAELVRLYDQQLRAIDESLVVKTIPLRFSSTDRTGYYLFLTTRDANGALKMNEVLRKAEFREHYALWADYLERTRQNSEQSGELLLDLGDTPQVPAPPSVEKADPEEVAKRVATNCGRGQFKLKQVLARMANEPFTEAEVKSGLTLLKRHGRAAGAWQKVADVVEILA